jgi:hypothetical protein
MDGALSEKRVLIDAPTKTKPTTSGSELYSKTSEYLEASLYLGSEDPQYIDWER